MKLILFLSFFTILVQSVYSQSHFIHGIAKDNKSGIAISYANIRVLNSSLGTSANKNGEYELRLQKGNYKLTASCIGFITDTISIDLDKDIYGVNFRLTETNINLPAITVLPSENPAIPIIKEAITKKKERDEKLLSYEYNAYTKGIIRTQKDISAKDNSVGLGLGSDTSALKITGILENESKGFFKKPDEYKEEITARKQSANFPSSINILTGGRVLQNFYNDKINFLGRDLPGPLADNALEYYYYTLINTLGIDNRPVYQIYIEPQNPHDPGFIGFIYITGNTYNLIKVELGLNRAANTGGLFDSVNVFQQLSEFQDSIYMPVDYRIFVTANYLSLLKFGLELNTILYDYKINPELDNDIFSKAVLTVLPNADRKDSTFWKDAFTIPNTSEELKAYKRIDSLENVPRTFWDNLNILSTRINITDDFSVSAPLAMYHFNRVEGHALDFGFFVGDEENERLSSSLKLDYGFSDKLFKSDLNTSYLLGDYRIYKISFGAFNKLNVLFGGSDYYNDLTSTALALLSKYEFRDYYYSKGFSFGASGEVFPVLNLSLDFINHTDNSASNNSNFSFFDKNRIYSLNPHIFDTKINSISAGFNFDFRDYIEDGLFRRRITMGKSYAVFGGSIIYSNSSFLKSNLDYTEFEFKSSGTINTLNSAALYFKIYGMYTRGSLPYQMLYAVPGNIDLTAQSFTFRTLNVNEFLGDRVVTIYLQHNFNDELFRLIPISFIQNLDLRLMGYLNIAYSDVSNKAKLVAPYPLLTFKQPFYEAGFEIGQVLFPLQLDFAWRLNYRGGNNFRVGINTFIF